MRKSLWDKRSDERGTERRQAAQTWALPDMECVPHEGIEPHGGSRHRPWFEYEEADLHAAGEFAAELVEWHLSHSHRIQWRFMPEGSTRPMSRPLEYLTGTVYRAGNHLNRLLDALEGIEGVPPAALAHDADPGSLNRALHALDPDTLLGRRCRIRVEHARDELGDMVARIVDVSPETALS